MPTTVPAAATGLPSDTQRRPALSPDAGFPGTDQRRARGTPTSPRLGPAPSCSREGTSIARRALAVTASGSVTRIPHVEVKPSLYRPPRYDPPRDKAKDRQIAESFEQSVFGLFVGYEIQAKCGVVPLTKDEEGRRGAHRKMAEKRLPKGDVLSEEFMNGLRASADRLIDQLACTHCMARGECPQAGKRRALVTGGRSNG